MVDSVGSSTSSNYSASSSASSSLDASYDMFLQLLVTQLQTQNPLDPTDATEFTNQLATYASLEQEIATNDKLDEVLSGMSLLSLSNGAGYLGHTVDAEADTVSVDEDGTAAADWLYSVGADAAEVTLTIVDGDGNTVWTGKGSTDTGPNTLDWDGKDSDGNAVAAGDYTLQVEAVEADGDDVSSSISIRGTVTAIDSSGGSVVLELGDTRIELDDVTRLAA